MKPEGGLVAGAGGADKPMNGGNHDAKPDDSAFFWLSMLRSRKIPRLGSKDANNIVPPGAKLLHRWRRSFDVVLSSLLQGAFNLQPATMMRSYLGEAVSTSAAGASGVEIADGDAGANELESIKSFTSPT
jgi:hypothetical protein